MYTDYMQALSHPVIHGAITIGHIRYRNKGTQGTDINGNLICAAKTLKEAETEVLEHWHRTLRRPCWCE